MDAPPPSTDPHAQVTLAGGSGAAAQHRSETDSPSDRQRDPAPPHVRGVHFFQGSSDTTSASTDMAGWEGVAGVNEAVEVEVGGAS